MTTVYPAALDTWTDKVDDQDTVRAADINQAYERILAIEEILGLNPQGGYATVAARLAVATIPGVPFIQVLVAPADNPINPDFAWSFVAA
jgi:hypothetical protein